MAFLDAIRSSCAWSAIRFRVWLALPDLRAPNRDLGAVSSLRRVLYLDTVPNILTYWSDLESSQMVLFLQESPHFIDSSKPFTRIGRVLVNVSCWRWKYFPLISSPSRTAWDTISLADESGIVFNKNEEQESGIQRRNP